ncbi:hypothetical protein ACWDCO_33085 [Streptomyces albogriseolus]
MGLYELQLKRDPFLNMMQAWINDRPLPVAEMPGFTDRWLERLLCTIVEIRSANEVPPDANLAVGAIPLRATIEVHHTTYEDARQAGSLTRPATAVATLHLWIAFNATGSGLSIMPAAAEINGTQLDVSALPVDPLTVPWPKELTVAAATLRVEGSLIVIRVATSVGTSLSGPVIDRTAGADWAQLLGGDLLAEQVTSGLAAQLDELVAVDKRYKLEEAVTGSWMWPIGSNIYASGVIERSRACLTTDVDVTVQVGITFEPQPAEGTALVKMRISWELSAWDEAVCAAQALMATVAASFLPFVGPLMAGLGRVAGWSSFIFLPMVFGDIAAEKVKSITPPDDTRKISEGDDYVEWQRTMSLGPRTSDSNVVFSIQSADVDFAGLTSRGSLRSTPLPRELIGYPSPAMWKTNADCKSRQVSQNYTPASVTLQHTTWVPLALLPPFVRTDPPEAWEPRIVPTATGVEIFVPRSTRVGTHLALWVHTASGLRWIDLGIVPAKPEPLTSAEIAAALNPCLALQKHHLGKQYKWLVDPPKKTYGHKLLREWALAGKDLGAGSAIDVMAIGPGGRERLISTLDPIESQMSFQVLTEADEELELRTDREGHSGLLMAQRWITPWARVPITSGPASLAVSNGLIEVQTRDGGKLLADLTGRVLAAHDGPIDNYSPADNREHDLRHLRSRRAGPTTIVAVDEHDLVIGKAGPLHTIGSLKLPQR